MAGRRLAMPYLRIDPLKVDVARVADVMSIRYAETRRALPVSVGLSEVTVATCEPLDTAWVRRDRGPHQEAAAAGAGSARSSCSASRPSSTPWRARCARRPRRGETVGAGQLRAAGRAGQEQQAARRQRPGRGAGGRLAVAVRLRPARERHPPRAAARDGRDPLSHRRRAAHRLPGADLGDERDDRARQAARPHGRGREAPAARRPHQDGAPDAGRPARRRGRDAPVDAADGLRREDGDAHLRSRHGGQERRGAGLRRARGRALGRTDGAAARHHPRHRADRQRQDDHAVRHAEAAGHRRGQRLHDRGPDRDDRAGLQPDAGADRASTSALPKACAR